MYFNFDYLKTGFRIRRKSWLPGTWICLGESRDIGKEMFGNLHLRRLADKRPEITAKILPFIIHCAPDLTVSMGWMLSQRDFVAGDWEVIQEPI